MARTRAPDYETKRLTILHRSAELFATFGYSGTSITMISKSCGSSKALLYHYYNDKEEILFDIIHAHLVGLIAASERAAASTQDPDERIFALTAGLLEAYRGADAEHQVQLANLKLLPEARQEILRAMERRLVEIFSEALAEAVPKIEGSRLIKPLTMSLFGMLNWHYLWFRDGRGLSRDEYARLIARLTTAGASAAAEDLVPSTGAAVFAPQRIAGDPRQEECASVSRRRARGSK